MRLGRVQHPRDVKLVIVDVTGDFAQHGSFSVQRGGGSGVGRQAIAADGAGKSWAVDDEVCCVLEH
jgi:hypothetical protein